MTLEKPGTSRHLYQPTRRDALALSGVAGLVALFGPSDVAMAASGRSLATIIAEAKGQVGKRLAGSPWSQWYPWNSGDWCAVFVSWLLRDNGYPRNANAGYPRTYYGDRGQTGVNPRVGALVMYDWNGNGLTDHVGFVYDISNGVVQTVEGNVGGSRWDNSIVKIYTQPYDTTARRIYAYPDYSSTDTGNPPPANTARQGLEQDEEFMIYRNGDTGQIGYFGAGVYVFKTLDDYKRWALIINLFNQRNPNTPKPTPPNGDDVNSFISLDSYGWGVMTAVHGGTR